MNFRLTFQRIFVHEQRDRRWRHLFDERRVRRPHAQVQLDRRRSRNDRQTRRSSRTFGSTQGINDFLSIRHVKLLGKKKYSYFLLRAMDKLMYSEKCIRVAHIRSNEQSFDNDSNRSSASPMSA